MSIAPSPFRSEYQIEMEGWLRARFRRLCYVYIALEGLSLFVNLLQLGRASAFEVAIPVIAAAANLGFVVAFLLAGRWEHATREQVVRAATWLIIVLGGVMLLSRLIVTGTISGDQPNLLALLFFWHLSACVLLPWTPRESLRPLIVLLGLWAIATLWLGRSAEIILILLSPMILVPGLAICSWRLRRHGRLFHTRMIGKHFWSMRQEFQRARGIHESMFPKPAADESVRFDYAYSPATDIGGDFIHLHVSEKGVWHLALLDVTGHGLPAALTVNRLYGELERIRAESPDAEPSEVLTLLNRYFYLTLQRHTIYATAIVVSLNPRSEELRWSSAGHPPAFLRGANRKLRELGATETLLGALSPDEFNAGQRSVKLSPGDTLIAYTDGAIEATDRGGRQFSLDGIRKVLMADPPHEGGLDISRGIAAAVKQHAAGRTDDDILVAALNFGPMMSEPHRQSEGEALVRSS